MRPAAFLPVSAPDAELAVARCRQLFDTSALVHAFTSEVNSLSEQSPPESLARLIVGWAAENLTDQHAILDDATCMRIEINEQLALCILETVFVGAPAAPESERYRSIPVRELFRVCRAPGQDVQLD